MLIRPAGSDAKQLDTIMIGRKQAPPTFCTYLHIVRRIRYSSIPIIVFVSAECDGDNVWYRQLIFDKPISIFERQSCLQGVNIAPFSTSVTNKYMQYVDVFDISKYRLMPIMLHT